MSEDPITLSLTRRELTLIRLALLGRLSPRGDDDFLHEQQTIFLKIGKALNPTNSGRPRR